MELRFVLLCCGVAAAFFATFARATEDGEPRAAVTDGNTVSGEAVELQLSACPRGALVADFALSTASVLLPVPRARPAASLVTESVSAMLVQGQNRKAVHEAARVLHAQQPRQLPRVPAENKRGY